MYLPRGKIKVIYINCSLNALLSTYCRMTIEMHPLQLDQQCAVIRELELWTPAL